jgi:hypothetical protein
MNTDKHSAVGAAATGNGVRGMNDRGMKAKKWGQEDGNGRDNFLLRKQRFARTFYGFSARCDAGRLRQKRAAFPRHFYLCPSVFIRGLLYLNCRS